MAIAYVNGSNGSHTSGTTITLSALSATTGNCIVISTAATHGTAANRSVSSISDTAGNTYASLGTTYTSGTSRIELWAAFNITGNASNVVTVTFGGTPTDAWACRAQFSGVATTSANDTGFAPAGNSDATTPYTSTAATTAADNEWVIGSFFSAGEDNTFGNSGSSVVRQTSVDQHALVTLATTSAGSYSVACTFGVETTMMILARAIKVAVAATSVTSVYLFY